MSDAVFKLGQWNNVVVINNGSNVGFIYQNGVLVKTGTVTKTSGTSVVTLGRRNDTPSQYLAGIIDEVIIESRAWTAKEVETYYRKSVLNYSKGFWANIVPLILSAAKGVFTLTGKTTTFDTKISSNKGVFSIVGKVARLVLSGWNNISKSVSSWTSGTKNESTWTSQTKNDSTWSNQSKS